MNVKTFALDKNLGFVDDDPKWQLFFKKFNIKTVFYEDLNKMSEDIKMNKMSFCYLPSANYFFLKSDLFYTPIANALFTANQKSKISSLLIVSKESKISTLAELKGKRLGCINFFCTSSYFAPALLLKRNGFSIHNFFSSIQEVGAWQLQINAVIAGKVDATMIQEDVWYSLPSNNEKTKIIDKVDHLPSPIILCATTVPEELKRELMELLFSNDSKPKTHSLFNGFIPYQKELVETFCEEASHAFSSNHSLSINN